MGETGIFASRIIAGGIGCLSLAVQLNGAISSVGAVTAGAAPQFRRIHAFLAKSPVQRTYDDRRAIWTIDTAVGFKFHVMGGARLIMIEAVLNHF